MKSVNITISYNAINSQSDDLATQEITETVQGLVSSLKSQVNSVQFEIVTKPE
jgi:hypothetical protein